MLYLKSEDKYMTRYLKLKPQQSDYNQLWTDINIVLYNKYNKEKVVPLILIFEKHFQEKFKLAHVSIEVKMLIKEQVKKLVEVSSLELNKSYFRKFIDRIYNYIAKKPYIPLEKTLEDITKIAEEKISKIVNLTPEDKLKIELKLQELVLKEMPKYKLLDNLADIYKIRSLNNRDLKHLYMLAMTEPTLNFLTKESGLDTFSVHDSLNSKQSNLNREQMIRNMEEMLAVRDTNLPSMDFLNQVKFIKAERILPLLEESSKIYKKSGNINPILLENSAKNLQAMKKYRDYYFYNQVVDEFISELDPKGKEYLLLNMYKNIGENNALEKLKEDLMHQFITSKNNLANELNGYEKIDSFRKELHQQLKMPKITGHVNGAFEAALRPVETKQKSTTDPLLDLQPKVIAVKQLKSR